jgi:hypothetical protein
MAKKACRVCGTVRDEEFMLSYCDELFCGTTCFSAFQNAVKQDALVNAISNKDIMIALKALFVAIANPSYVDKTTNQLRAQVTGSVTSSTTVAVSDVTLKGGYQPKVEILANNIGAWAVTVRDRIT